MTDLPDDLPPEQTPAPAADPANEADAEDPKIRRRDLRRAAKRDRRAAAAEAEAALLADPTAAPGLTPQDTLLEAGRKVLRFQFHEMLRHEDGTRLGEDIEALHDMRVASRRMRAAFEIFAPAFARKPMQRQLHGLRAAGRALGTVRDLDVFMQKAERYAAELPPEERHGLDPLLASWQAQRQAGRATLLKLFDSPSYAAFKEDFETFTRSRGQDAAKRADGCVAPHDLVRDAAPLLIYTRLARVRAFEDGLEAASIETLHALRIEFKKLRYAVEFFREVLGPEAREVITDLKKIQDHLGDLNDAQVATQLLQGFLAEWDQGQAATTLSDRPDPAAILAYLTFQHRERHRLIVTFPAAWAQFCHPEFRQHLGLALAAL